MVVAKRKDTIVEIRDLDDLLRVVKEVRAEDEPLVLQVDDGEEIVVSPAPRRARRRRLTPEERNKADEAAFLAAAGGWKGLIDGEAFKRQIKEGRGSKRPPVDLSRLGE